MDRSFVVGQVKNETHYPYRLVRGMEWRVIASHPAYEVSNTGLVRRGERVLKSRIRGRYYAGAILCMNGIETSHMVHRLMALAFIPNPDNKEMIDHINRIKTDNRIENLRWASRSENIINTARREHLHIYPHHGGHRVRIRRDNRFVYDKWFNTLDEAVINRDIAGLFV
jgi:hypothetical protein